MPATTPIASFCVGNALPIDHTYTGLIAAATGATITIKTNLRDTSGVVVWNLTATANAHGQVINQGLNPDGSGTYIAEVIINFTGTDTLAYFTPGVTTTVDVDLVPGPYTAEILEITPTVGGPNG